MPHNSTISEASISLEIRQARVDDAERLLEILKQLGYSLDLTQMAQRITAFASDNNHLLVAEHGQTIVGVIAFGIFELFRLPGKCCYIDALIIDTHYRGQGIGKQLLIHTENYAREQGVVTIELISANHRKAGGTHAFYEALGYKNSITLDCTYFEKNVQ